MLATILSSARSYFTLGNPSDRRFATRLDLWVGFFIYLSFSFIIGFALLPLAEAPDMLLTVVKALTALLLFPFWFLIGRRFKSFGLSAYLAIVVIVIGLILPNVVQFAVVFVLGIIPSKISVLSTPPAEVKANYLNPVFGFRPSRFFKFLGIFFGAMVIFFIVIALISNFAQ
jgi:hypothetical protein